MEKKVTPVKLYLSDRDFLENLKRKLKVGSAAESTHQLILLFKKNKLYLDLVKSNL